MKKVCFFLISLLIVNGAVGQWFCPAPSDTAYYKGAVYFTDTKTGYVSRSLINWAEADTIWKTTDGGMNWIPQYGGEGSIDQIFFPDANTGYAIKSVFNGWGTHSVVLKTANGGSDWIQTPLEPVYGLSSIFFTDANTGYAAGGRIILKTADGGQNWITILDDPNACIVSIFFIDASTGYAVGGTFNYPMHRTILKTTNGGLNWDYMLNEEGGALQAVYFTANDTGYVGGEFDLLKTTDGGIDWIEISYGSGSENYTSLYFTDSNTGYVVGGNYYGPFIIKTTDGGTNWFVQSIDGPYFGEGPVSVFFPVADTGYITDYRCILKTENGGGFPVGINEQSNNTSHLSIYPNPASTTINISMPTTPRKNTFITMLDITGKEVLKRELTQEQTVVDVSGLSQGVYLVKVTDDRSVMVGKFVKQ